MEALENAEERTLHMASAEYYMPLITCEEPVDISYLKADCAVDLSDAIACTNVGEVRHVLDRRLSQCMMTELCEEESPARVLSRGGSLGAELGASIFDYGSPMGIIPDESEDHWDRDLTTATWTRSIVVPRREFYHPSEGEGGPDLSTLSNKGLTVPSDGKSNRDDWRTVAIEDGPSAGELWAGKCVFSTRHGMMLRIRQMSIEWIRRRIFQEGWYSLMWQNHSDGRIQAICLVNLWMGSWSHLRNARR